MRYVTIKLDVALNTVMYAMEIQDPELCFLAASWIDHLSDLEIYDYSRSHKAGDKFDDEDFENVKAILLEFRENFLHGDPNFDIGSLYKDRPEIDKIF